jgi:hypothetical protein
MTRRTAPLKTMVIGIRENRRCCRTGLRIRIMGRAAKSRPDPLQIERTPVDTLKKSGPKPHPPSAQAGFLTRELPCTTTAFPGEPSDEPWQTHQSTGSQLHDTRSPQPSHTARTGLRRNRTVFPFTNNFMHLLPGALPDRWAKSKGEKECRRFNAGENRRQDQIKTDRAGEFWYDRTSRPAWFSKRNGRRKRRRHGKI